MADKGELFHNPKLASEVQNWHKIGENAGDGPDALAIHNAFMHSAGHRANILDSAFRQIGVGVVVKNGVVWVSEVFRQPEGAVATPSPTKPKPKPKPSPTPSPTHRASHSSSPVHHVTPKPAASSTPSPTHHASRAPTASPHSSAPPVKHSTSPSHSSAAPRPSVTESASPTSTPSSSPTVPLPPKGPAAGAPLDTKPADSSSGASGLAALGTLGILAVLGLALSLRVRSH